MATTPNYGWVMPDPTDFVTNLPADFEAFGDAVDADLAGLLGGTTGQVLVKNSGTDHDYDFATDPVSDIVTTAGDVLYGTAADTIARLGIGTAGQVLTVNSGATAPEWATAAAGGMTVLASGSLVSGGVDLQSIPATYKDLRLVMRNFHTTTDGNYSVTINATASVYFNALQPGGTNSAATFNPLNFAGSGTFDNRDADNTLILHIYDYASTISNKVGTSIFCIGNSSGSNFDIEERIIAARIPAALNRLNVVSSNTFAAGTYILYGVS